MWAVTVLWLLPTGVLCVPALFQRQASVADAGLALEQRMDNVFLGIRSGVYIAPGDILSHLFMMALWSVQPKGSDCSLERISATYLLAVHGDTPALFTTSSKSMWFLIVYHRNLKVYVRA